jgi:putative serine protease PepD
MRGRSRFDRLNAMSEIKPPESRRPWLPWAAAGVALVVGGVVGGVIANATASQNSGQPGRAAGSSSAAACEVTPVANEVVPSVVTIAASAAGGNESGTGSGEVIRSEGYILTNNHVISVAADGGSVQVLFADGATAPATITGRDPQTDLAVLKIQPSHQLKVIQLGSSTSVKVGQPVVAIGAPLGLSGTVTSGIVSALDRTVQVPGENDKSALLVSAVQTDAAINPGNSGGALVNCAGQLVGVPTAGATVPSPSGPPSGGSIGLGFAIPVDLAKSIADEIISTGRVTHAYFGLQTTPIPPGTAQAGVPEGLYVHAVASDGPAARAGLRPGDVITEIDGKPATTNIQLQELTLTKKPGDTVAITYSRSGQSAKATVTLGAQP